MGRVKATEWSFRSSTVASPESEAAMKDDSSEIDTAMSKMLRIMLGNSDNNQPIIPHSILRQKALAGADNDVSKCVVDLALLNLLNQGLLSRHGYGNFALYTIPQDAVHEATELAYFEFSTEESTYSIQQQQQQQQYQGHHQQQTSLMGFIAPPLPISAPPCSIFRPASPRPRSGRSYSTEKMSSALHLVRLNGKRSHSSSTNSLNTEESMNNNGGGNGIAREKRARLGRPTTQQPLLLGGTNHSTVPMSP